MKSRHRQTRRVYDKALTYEKLYAAWNTVLHTCKNKQGLYEFAMFQQAKLSELLDELKERKYWPNKYRCFMIFEPKPRLVMSQSIRDKVVNHFVAREYLIPLLERTLIDANVATRMDMGSSYAMKMLKRYFAKLYAEDPSRDIFALKIDISKYFYRIDHDILFEKLSRKVKDKDVLEILHRIIDEANKPYINRIIDVFNEKFGTEIPHYEKNKGLSIGAMTSQFLAIFYLSDLDRHLKEDLGCRYFLRYMDDLIILDHDKDKLYRFKDEIKKCLADVKLEVNPKSAMYNCSSYAGVPFLGYRYFIDTKGTLRIVPLSGTVRRIRKRLKLLKTHDPEKYLRSEAAYRGYFMHAVPAWKMEDAVASKQI